MESISVFDIIKIGIGPSSSHTMGPWLAAADYMTKSPFPQRIKIHLYGSLAKTGVGHGTDIASLMGLAGYDYTQVDPEQIPGIIEKIKKENRIDFHSSTQSIPFYWSEDLIFHKQETLPFHPNGMVIETLENGVVVFSQDYYSLGGGFISIGTSGVATEPRKPSPYPCHQAEALLRYTQELGCSIPELVRINEETWASSAEIDQKLNQIWEEINACIYRGVHREGILPGGLQVKRRAADLNKKLLLQSKYTDVQSWILAIQSTQPSFERINKWISCFALAVNEENAAFGRIITAPTNGASGVIPAVLMYAQCFLPKISQKHIHDFLLTAGEIGTLFKKNATISAAMGGCQAEVGVSASMAAGGLTALLGGTNGQILQAAEIAMEHHLGLTCDPVGGLVQIPCIERNSMGAMKAITAAYIALESNPEDARVTLDDVIKSMWETSLDMHQKYKETSEGGLATTISVGLAEC
ncbi:MAG: L-serine ammonia-lyase [Spirosomataceae bacterium]